MSVIIATRMPDGRLFVAADSREVAGYDYKKIDGECAKLWEREDGLIFGGVGYASDAYALYYDDNFLPTKDLRDIGVRYLVNQHTYIVNRLLDFHGYTGPVMGGNSCRLDEQFCCGSEYLVAYNGEAFVVGGEGCVNTLSEEDDYDFLAIGSGSTYASAYLKAHLKEAKTPEDTKRIVTEAIKNAAQCTWTIDDNIISYVSEPIFQIPVDIDTAKALLEQAESVVKENDKVKSEQPADGSAPKVNPVKGRRPRRKKN